MIVISRRIFDRLAEAWDTGLHKYNLAALTDWDAQHPGGPLLDTYFNAYEGEYLTGCLVGFQLVGQAFDRAQIVMIEAGYNLADVIQVEQPHDDFHFHLRHNVEVVVSGDNSHYQTETLRPDDRVGTWFLHEDRKWFVMSRDPDGYVIEHMPTGERRRHTFLGLRRLLNGGIECTQ